MIDVVEEKSDGMSVKAEEKEFIANFYKYAFVGMTLEWIKNGMKTVPEQMIDHILRAHRLETGENALNQFLKILRYCAAKHQRVISRLYVYFIGFSHK